MESVIYQNRPQYYKAIEAAGKANDSGVFIEFTLSALLETIEIQAKQKDESAKEFVEKTSEFVEKFVEKFAENETQRIILRLMIERPAISAKKIAGEAGISSRGVQKSIAALKKRGLVERTGSAKGGHWLVKT